MRKIRLVFLVVILTVVSAVSIFAQNNSGYTSSLNAGSTFPVIYDKDKYDSDHTYNIYSTLQVGYLFDFGNRKGFSIVGELGYNFAAAANIYDISGFIPSMQGEIEVGTYMHSLVIGILPAFSINDFSIGIGGGIKVPVSGHISGTASFEEGFFLTGGQTIEDNIDMTPYVKLVFDYSLFVDTKTSIVFAFNTGYDFKIGNKPYKASPEAYYMGFQIGIKFGPRL